jgi:hypothetical protein
MSCPYANLLGEPNTGVHSIRILGFAFVDILLTIIVAFITAKLFKINFWYIFIVWFVLGEILHYFFGVNSAFLKIINLSPNCNDN